MGCFYLQWGRFRARYYTSKMMFNPHKLGIHKILKHIPLNAIFDAPYKRRLAKAVNIADLRLIAKSRAHKVRRCSLVKAS